MGLRSEVVQHRGNTWWVKRCTTRPCTRQGAEVWPISFVGGQSLRRALQVKAGVLHAHRLPPTDYAGHPEANEAWSACHQAAAFSCSQVPAASSWVGRLGSQHGSNPPMPVRAVGLKRPVARLSHRGPSVERLFASAQLSPLACEGLPQ